MAKVKQIKAKTVKQIHGASLLNDNQKDVNQLIGNTSKSLSGYKQNTLKEYSEYLNGLTLIDLHNHAISIAGIVPINNKILLIDRLEKEYARAAIKFVPQGQNQNHSMAAEDREAALRILRKGA